MNAPLNRRQLLAGIAAGSAALAAPAAALDAPFDVLSAGRDGLLTITLAGRAFVVDTADLPSIRVDTIADPSVPAWLSTDTISTPKAGKKYLVLTHDGSMAVSELCEGSTFGRVDDPRLGFMPAETGAHGQQAPRQCFVLGRVIAGAS